MFNINSLQLYSIYGKTHLPLKFDFQLAAREVYTSLPCLLSLPLLHGELQLNIAFNVKILFGRNGCYTVILFVKCGDAIIFPVIAMTFLQRLLTE